MESQPQNPEFRNNPENFHPCIKLPKIYEVQSENILRPGLKKKKFTNPTNCPLDIHLV